MWVLSLLLFWSCLFVSSAWHSPTTIRIARTKTTPSSKLTAGDQTSEVQVPLGGTSSTSDGTSGTGTSRTYPVDHASAPLSRRMILGASSFSIAAFLMKSPVHAAYIDPASSPPIITDRVFLDVEWVNTGSVRKQGRIIIGLYGQVMPKTVENFKTLCQQNDYAGTTFYRIISDYSIQGGAIGDTSDSGKTGRSAFTNTPTFEPDNYNIQHTKKGLVSMVKDTSGGVDSRFFIQFQDDAGWADDRYAAFGIVLDDGMKDVIDDLGKIPVQPPKNNPKQPVRIVASGVL